jgi:hypothetical protein
MKKFWSSYLNCLRDFIAGGKKNQGGFSGNGLIIHGTYVDNGQRKPLKSLFGLPVFVWAAQNGQ